MRMGGIVLDSLEDGRLEPYRRLKDREVAREGGRFIAEGWFIVQRLLASRFEIESVLVSRNRQEEVVSAVERQRPGVPVYVVAEAELSRVVGYKFHLGVLACGRRPREELWSLEEVAGAEQGAVDPGRTLVVAPQIINHENVGALARVSAALGADGMILGPESCDPFWRRAIRVSMGAVFFLPIRRCRDVPGVVRQLKEQWGYYFVAAVVDAAAAPVHQVERPADRPVAILIGPEDKGLDKELIREADRCVTIPMHRGMDSLNVAVAAGIVLHHFVSRKTGPGGAEWKTG